MRAETLQFDHLKNRAWLLPKLRRRVGEVGLMLTISEVLEQANIQVETEGDTSVLETPGQPAIAICDHDTGLECLCFFGACGKLGREDVSAMAKPYVPSGQLFNALAGESDAMLPLVPRTMARARRGGTVAMRINRHLFKRHFPDAEEIQAYNQRTMDCATDLLEKDGRLLSVFPAGSVHRPAEAPWRDGIGRLVAQLSPTARAETTLVPFAMEGLRPTRILLAILLSRIGLPVPRQAVTAKFAAEQRTLDELFPGELPPPETITRQLQHYYREIFPVDG